MNIRILENPRVICSNRNSLHNYFAWPTVARLPGGQLAMTASGLRLKHVDPFGKCILCYSFDEGKTWTPPAVVIDTPLDDRDGGIVSFGENVMVTSFNNRISTQLGWLDTETDFNIGSLSPDSVFRLYDNGDLSCRRKYLEGYLAYVDAEKAESDFLGSTYRISRDGGFTFGPVEQAPVTAPHGPAAAPDGTLYYVGNPYRTTDGAAHLQCWHMKESGEWELMGQIPNISETVGGASLLSCEPHAVILPHGKLLVHIRVQTAYTPGSNHVPYFTLWQSESTDGGRTFSQPRPICEDTLLGAPPHLLRLSDGTLVCTCGLREAPFGIRALISRDEGATWSEPFLLYDNGGISLDLGYPASVELRDGSILTVFYAHPEPGAPAEILQVIWRPEND